MGVARVLMAEVSERRVWGKPMSVWMDGITIFLIQIKNIRYYNVYILKLRLSIYYYYYY